MNHGEDSLYNLQKSLKQSDLSKFESLWELVCNKTAVGRCVPGAAKAQKEGGLLSPEFRDFGGSRQRKLRLSFLEGIVAPAVLRRQLLDHNLLQNRQRSHFVIQMLGSHHTTQMRLRCRS